MRRWTSRQLWCAAAAALALALPPAAAPVTPATPAAPCATNPLCVCRDDHFACSHVPFHRFPETDPVVWHVSVSAARLGALDEAALDARRLRTLVLVACRLHRLHPAALASMEDTLASLDLGYNEFTELPLDAIRELKVLNWLNLQNNFISEIDPKLDWGHLTESLNILSLSNNQVSVLSAGALSSLRRLSQLELDGNRVRAVAAGALPPAVALLRLSDNLLARVPCALAALPRLRHLHLRNNLLRRSADHACPAQRSKVDSLDLSHNELNDFFDFNFLSEFQLKQLILDLNDFTKIPSFPLEYSRLERLSLSYNRLTDVSEGSIQSLRRDLERLDLDHNVLISLPSSVRELTRLRYLSLAYNQLVELNDLPPRLHTLSAAGNYLTSFPSGLYELEPSTLVSLDLGYNQLTLLPHDAFGSWAGALVTLSLRGNQLAQLAADAFPPSLPVRELALSFNDLYHMDPRAFANLTNLRVLELSSTLFSGEFPLEALSSDMRWLTLDNNNIHHVKTTDLGNFPALEYLNLDFNKIVEFPSEMNDLNYSYKIKELKLSYNYIRKVSPEFLTTLTELQSLDLSYNRMHNISERCFENLGNLVYLSLAGNGLKLLNERAFHALPKLEVLDLQENYLEEFSTEYFSDVSSQEVTLAVNVSFNRLTTLVGGPPVTINILDLSHNLLENLPKSFFMSLSIRQLLLSHNRLILIDSFGTLPALQILSMTNNSITSIRRRTFLEMPSLQILDLSHNKLSQLATEQFHNNRLLRHLRLASNELRSLPRDCFKNTVLEHLDLSDNQLVLFPSSALAHVGFTLRHLELSRNRIEYLDSAMFRSTSFLYDLGLAKNALTVLSDNTFASLPRLFHLDLSYNAIKSNFKELFHNLPRLRRLALAGAGLKTVPPLPLMNLTQLDLAGNYISSYREADVKRLSNLRNLDIASNKITSLQPSMWAIFPKLTKLDISSNPLVRISIGSFDGLDRLLRLSMDNLWQLETVEPKAFRSLSSLRSLTLGIPSGDVPAAEMIEEVPGLECLILTMHSSVLDTQLHGIRAAKLRVLEVRGVELQRVSGRAFATLSRQAALTVRVRGTSLRALPPALLRPLARVPHLALDLADNRLVALAPATLYPNLTDWNRFATKLLSGGLVVSGNPLRCGCAVSWVGAWLRRWTAEVGGGAREARAAARAATCGAQAAGARPRPLLVVEADAARCHASALSSRAARTPRLFSTLPAFLWIVLLYSIS